MKISVFLPMPSSLNVRRGGTVLQKNLEINDGLLE